MPSRRKQRRPRAIAQDQGPAAEPLTLGAEQLAAHLLSPLREAPVVVVAVPPSSGFRIDVRHLARQLDGEADVAVITTGPETYRLKELLPAEAGIFGNAGRVYSADLAWINDPYSSPLHIVWTELDVASAQDALITDARTMAYQAGRHDWLHLNAPTVPPSAAPRKATVQSLLAGGTRAIVQLEDGVLATIQQDQTLPLVPLDWILSVDQAVRGTYDTVTASLDIGGLLSRPTIAGYYADGGATLALVTDVAPTSATLSLFPGADFAISVGDISSNELDIAVDLLTVGEVVTVRVRYVNGAVRLSMLDVDDDEPLTAAPALVLGGPPWLLPDRHLRTGDSGESEAGYSKPVLPARPIESLSEAVLDPPVVERRRSLATTQLSLEAARHENERLREQLSRLEAVNSDLAALRLRNEEDRENTRLLESQLHSAERRIQQLTEEIRKTKEDGLALRKKYRQARGKTSSQEIRALFSTAEEQLRHELYMAWVERVPPDLKPTHTLGEFIIGPSFIASLESLPEDKRGKALRVVVDLVANLPAFSERGAHALRVGPAANAQPISRPDGGSCWRVAIERGTEAARRLHYWRCQDGSVELSRVVVHEDMKP